MVISVSDAYRLRPDGTVDMDLFRRFSAQQKEALNNMRENTVSTPVQQYMQANPDVLEHAFNTAAAGGVDPGADFGARAQQAAAQHFIDHGVTEGREGFGLPLSSFGSTDPVHTEPFPVASVTAPMTTFDPTTGQDTPSMMTGPTNYGPAPLPGQLPCYSFTGNPDLYANSLGTMGGLLNDTSAYYAGQVPAAPTTAVQTGGYNFPELARYPNANYAAGISPFIWTY